MAGSPKGGFPARRPGKLFGKKQMVMFGCIVLVLFVAPSLFGIARALNSDAFCRVIFYEYRRSRGLS